MSAWLWFPASGVFVVVVYVAAASTAAWVADRRWARLQRENDRRKLRYATWAAVAKLGGR